MRNIVLNRDGNMVLIFSINQKNLLCPNITLGIEPTILLLFI